MTPPDAEQNDNKSRDSALEKTVILQRCPKHGIVYMANEECPECAKEKNASKGNGA